eukprot:g2442.t1
MTMSSLYGAQKRSILSHADALRNEFDVERGTVAKLKAAVRTVVGPDSKRPDATKRLRTMFPDVPDTTFEKLSSKALSEYEADEQRKEESMRFDVLRRAAKAAHKAAHQALRASAHAIGESSAIEDMTNAVVIVVDSLKCAAAASDIARSAAAAASKWATVAKGSLALTSAKRAFRVAVVSATAASQFAESAHAAAGALVEKRRTIAVARETANMSCRDAYLSVKLATKAIEALRRRIKRTISRAIDAAQFAASAAALADFEASDAFARSIHARNIVTLRRREANVQAKSVANSAIEHARCAQKEVARLVARRASEGAQLAATYVSGPLLRRLALKVEMVVNIYKASLAARGATEHANEVACRIQNVVTATACGIAAQMSARAASCVMDTIDAVQRVIENVEDAPGILVSNREVITFSDATRRGEKNDTVTFGGYGKVATRTRAIQAALKERADKETFATVETAPSRLLDTKLADVDMSSNRVDLRSLRFHGPSLIRFALDAPLQRSREDMERALVSPPSSPGALDACTEFDSTGDLLSKMMGRRRNRDSELRPNISDSAARQPVDDAGAVDVLMSEMDLVTTKINNDDDDDCVVEPDCRGLRRKASLNGLAVDRADNIVTLENATTLEADCLTAVEDDLLLRKDVGSTRLATMPLIEPTKADVVLRYIQLPHEEDFRWDEDVPSPRKTSSPWKKLKVQSKTVKVLKKTSSAAAFTRKISKGVKKKVSFGLRNIAGFGAGKHKRSEVTVSNAELGDIGIHAKYRHFSTGSSTAESPKSNGPRELRVREGFDEDDRAESFTQRCCVAEKDDMPSEDDDEEVVAIDISTLTGRRSTVNILTELGVGDDSILSSPPKTPDVPQIVRAVKDSPDLVMSRRGSLRTPGGDAWPPLPSGPCPYRDEGGFSTSSPGLAPQFMLSKCPTPPGLPPVAMRRLSAINKRRDSMNGEDVPPPPPPVSADTRHRPVTPPHILIHARSRFGLE